MTASPGTGGAASLRQRSAQGLPSMPSAAFGAGLASILSQIGDDLARVEKEFVGNLGSDVQIIDTLGRYVGEGGGKRIRPALFLLCCRLCNYRGDHHVLFASVFELIHTATLVHDDIIDGSEKRRGRRTANARWGSHLTVLLGDYLYLKSMTRALSADDLRCIKILCEITLTMIEGELMQAHRSGAVDITEKEHLEIVRRKTAMLFAGCGRVAAELSGASREKAAALEAYARNLGMAYQLVDDLLDFTATESVLGKPVASDLREGRLTLPLIYLLEMGVEDHRRTIRTVIEDGGFERVRPEEILDLVKTNGTLDRTRRLAQAYSQEACRSLAPFDPGPARRALEDVAGFITSREY